MCCLAFVLIPSTTPAQGASRFLEGSTEISVAKPPVVAYNSGFAAVVADSSGDILLFTRPFSSTTWTKTVVNNASVDGTPFEAPTLTAHGKHLVIIAIEDSTASMYSWVGKVGQ